MAAEMSMRQHNSARGSRRSSRGHDFQPNLQAFGQQFPYRSNDGTNGTLESVPRSLPTPTLDRHYDFYPSTFFRFGTVFSVLWAEPAGRGSAASDHTYITEYNQRIFSNIRRMVVFKEGRGCSSCFPISTYGGQGVAKPGVDPRSHSAIYIRGTPPDIGPREVGMKDSLQVTPCSPRDRLLGKSRLIFGKPYNVEHNIKVRPIGTISQEFMQLYNHFVRESMHIPNIHVER